MQVQECFFETTCKKSHYEWNNSNNVKSMLGFYNHHIHILNVHRKYFRYNFHTAVVVVVFFAFFFNLSFSDLVLHPFKQILHLCRFPERGNFLFFLLALRTCSSLFKTQLIFFSNGFWRPFKFLCSRKGIPNTFANSNTMSKVLIFFTIYVFKQKFFSLDSKWHVVLNSSRFVAVFRLSGIPMRVVFTVPTVVIFCLRSQLANEMLVYSLLVDMFLHFRHISFSVAFTRYFT